MTVPGVSVDFTGLAELLGPYGGWGLLVLLILGLVFLLRKHEFDIHVRPSKDTPDGS